MACVLGFFAADGTMILNNRGSCFIEFTSCDRVVLERIHRAARSANRISARPARNARWKQQYRLQIGSKAWFYDLARLGFAPKKSKVMKWPDIPKPFFSHFVRGYFDGDGCVYFNRLECADRSSPRWVVQTLFTSGSLEFLQALHMKLHDAGLAGGSLSRKERGFDLRFSRRDSLALCHLMYHTPDIADLFLPRKRQKLEAAMQVLHLAQKCGCSSAG